MTFASVRVSCKFVAVLIAASFSAVAAPPPTLHQVFNPYWATGYGRASTIELHNNLVNQPLDVRPVLLSRSGERTELPMVHLTPLGNASIDVQQILNRIGRSDLHSGSAIFEYMHPYNNALLAETTVRESAHTLQYTIIGAERGTESDTLYGVYWFPKHAQGEVYVALQNASAQPVHITASLGARSAPYARITLAPGASGIVEAEVPPNGNVFSELSGSVIIRHDASPGTLYTSGWIEAENLGYSNMMTLYDRGYSKGNRLFGTQVFLGRNPNLFTGEQRLHVESSLMLLNTSDEAVTAQATLYYENGGAIASLPIGVPVLRPSVPAVIPLYDLRLPPQASATGSIVVDYTGPEAALMGRAFGVAQDTFGFYTTLDNQLAGSYAELYWTTGGDHDSFLTVANFGDKPDTITIEVTHNAGSAALPPFLVQPNQSVTINVREWKRRGLLPRRPTWEASGSPAVPGPRAV